MHLHDKQLTLTQLRYIWPIILFIHLAPGDYTSIPISEAIPVNFGSGQLSMMVTVSIQNDNTMEPDEIFFGRLRRLGTGDVLITQNRAEVTIVNDDGMLVHICIMGINTLVFFS